MPVGKRELSTNPAAVKWQEQSRTNRARGLCNCGKPLIDKSRCPACLKNCRNSQAKLRNTVLDAYGGKCVCCGELERKFLAVDHIEGNGNQHRLLVGGHKKSNILRWLIKNNFPLGFQLLCHNCNMAKAIYGVCPHRADLGV